MRYLGLLLLPLLITGCVSRVQMDKNILAGKTVAVPESITGAFMQKTFEDFNNDWWNSNPEMGQPKIAPKIDSADLAKSDPTPAITDAIKKLLTEEIHMKLVKDSSEYTANFRGSWGIKHHPIALTQYKIYYDGHFTFEGTQSEGAKKPMYEWFTCSYSTASKYSYDEIFADKAALVKEALKPAAAKCIGELTQKLRAELAKDTQ